MHNKIAGTLLHPDPVVRRQAANTIGMIGVRPDTAAMVVGTLTRSLNDPDPEVRVYLFSALYRLGPYSKPAVPKAVEELKNPDPRIRRAASTMIGNLLADNKDLMAVVISALDDQDIGPDEKMPHLNSVSYRAMRYLNEQKLAAKDAAPKIIAIVNSKNGSDERRTHALGVLASIAPENPLPLKAARDWVQNKQSAPDLVKAAIMMRRLGVHAKDAVPDLIGVLKMKPFADTAVESTLKRVVLETLRAIGPAAKEALPTLEAMTTTDDLMIRTEILETIKIVRGKD